MRGGVSYVANRYGKANNKYMKEHDEKAPSKYIMYLDANNLYGWAMSQYLPTGNFKWMTDKEISKIDLGKYKADSKKGLILEVDLEYPQELHDMNNILSAYCKKIAENYNISIGQTYSNIKVQVTQIFGFNIFSYFKNLGSNRGFRKVFSILAHAKHV